jgi:excisionase family DNA binding protein
MMTAPKIREVPRPTDAPSPWITVKEAAAYLGVSIYTVYDACKLRGLKHVKLGHSTIRLRRDWLDKWMETRVR